MVLVVCVVDAESSLVISRTLTRSGMPTRVRERVSQVVDATPQPLRSLH